MVSTYEATVVNGKQFATVTNKEPASLDPLTTWSLEQVTKTTNEITDYTIKFTPINAIPKAGSIQMTYPQQIQFEDGGNTKCIVELDNGDKFD